MNVNKLIVALNGLEQLMDGKEKVSFLYWNHGLNIIEKMKLSWNIISAIWRSYE